MKSLPKIIFFVGFGLLIGIQYWASGLTALPGNVSGHDEGIDPLFVMQAITTLAVLAASLFVIIAKRYSAKDKHWAYATVGTIIGFWLHSSK
jgi:hypothetical protein